MRTVSRLRARPTPDLRVVTLAERPELRAVVERADAAAYPPFLVHAEMASRWPAVFAGFPDYQLALVDQATGQVCAHANSVPFVWSGTHADLPSSAVALIDRAVHDRASHAAPTALGALQAVVHVGHQRSGLSVRVLTALAATASQAVLPDLFAPIRPTEKARYPLTTLERYAGWRRPDGLPRDPWMRVHHRLGAAAVHVAPAWTAVNGTVADWERWTGMAFPETGRYVVPGAMVPVRIDIEHDHGRYEEPHLWMRYRIHVGDAEAA